MLLKEGDIRNVSGCAITSVIDRSGKKINGKSMIDSIRVMHERSNGLGGGFAGYGIYPEYKEYYAFHLFYDTKTAKELTESFLIKHFEWITEPSLMQTHKIAQIQNEPHIYRYFLAPLPKKLQSSQLDEAEYIVHTVKTINSTIEGAFVFSSGKNMGVFKGVGYPEDIGQYFCLDEYEGYAWTCHGRYPTNTPGWWGGAHPFALLDFTVVHNGEISSYDANRRYIEMFGYKCSLQTDTEVITYIFDYLIRKKGLTFDEVAKVIAPSFWSTIANKPKEQQEEEILLRRLFPSLCVTGPFSIIVGFEGGMMGLNDRLKLRSMVCAEYGNLAFIASEEAAIRAIAPQLDKVYVPAGGEPVLYTLYEKGGN